MTLVPLIVARHDAPASVQRSRVGPGRESLRCNALPQLLAALGQALLAGWAAGTGAALLDVSLASAIPTGAVIRVLALATALYGTRP
jgi:hypothetical protein